MLPILLSFFLAGTARADVTLEQAFQAAIQRRDKVKILNTQIAQFEERKNQARGTFLPQVSLIANYTRSENSPKDRDAKSSRINLTQSLFRGLQDVRDFQIANLNLDAEKQNAEFQKIQIFATVAQSFYQVYLFEEDLKILDSLTALTEKRVKELQGRYKIGRSRKGEWLSAKSQLLSIQAQMETTRSGILQEREHLAYLTGISSTDTLIPPKEAALVPKTLDNMDVYVKSVSQRQDLTALQKQYEASKRAIQKNEGAHLPALDLVGNYYLDRDSGVPNSTSNPNGDWDVGLTLTFPLFAGGKTSALVRESEKRKDELALTLDDAKLQAEAQVRQQYLAVKSGMTQIQILTEAQQTAEENYNEQVKDYKYSLVDNLDVLEALNTLQKSRKDLKQAQLNILVDWVTLQASVGKIPFTNFKWE